jgi:predicted  nucleic acid-binding Zn-ribbon protein
VHRAREDADRAASEAARSKAHAADLERALAAARSEARAAGEAAAAAARELDALRRQREEDVAGLMGEVGRMRDKIRDAEHDLGALRTEQQVGGRPGGPSNVRMPRPR